MRRHNLPVKAFLVLILFIFFGMAGAFAQYQKLHDFSSSEGMYPMGDLVTDSTYLYGMTSAGGANDGGTIFRIKTDGTGFLKLHDFADTSGMNPNGSLVILNGILYGVARTGGVKGGGVLFSIDTAGVQYKVLHAFPLDSTTGYYPAGTLFLIGNLLYGMTERGGVYGNHGIIFRNNTEGTDYKVMYGNDQPDYCRFGDRLTYYKGNLYGMISEGQGNSSAGAVFRINRMGYGFATIFDFSTTNGETPLGFPIIADSLIFGMTSAGGPDSAGVVFRMEQNGLFFDLLKSFNKVDPGGYPNGSLLNDSITFYGMCRGLTPEQGCIFRILKDGSGYSVLHTFLQGTDGYYPDGTLILLNGRLYGMTERGGAEDAGAVFSYSLVPQGIQEVRPLPEISISPNPVADLARITCSEEIQMITLTDMNGRIVAEVTGPGRNMMIGTSTLPDGVYILRCTGKDFSVSRKLLKSSR